MTEINLTGVWPEWKIEKQIGKGTFGAVYQAVRESDNLTSYAAIKFISIPQDPYELESLRADGLDLQATRAYLKRIVDDFVNEIRLLESFKGIQNIVSIEDYKVVEKADGLGWDIYIRMELLTPFSAYICDKKLTEREVIQLGCDICTALDICSRKNIIHRDIKPENIFVNSFGSFKLGDFDTARQMESLTGGLSQKGTYNYMAPEVVSGEDYDVRVDVYSLGLVLYRLMNGNRLPFISEKQLLSPSERRAAFERRVRGEALPAPCEASPALAQVILKACAFDPRDRYASAAEMRRALRELEREPVPALAAAPAPEPKQGKKPASQGKKPAPRRGKPAAANKKAKARDSRLAVWILSSLAVLVLVLCGVLAWLSTAHPTQMEIWRVPEKREYIVGDTLDPTGLQMLVYYDDGSCGTVEEGFRCSPKKLKTVGTQEITVSYRGFQDTFSVEVTSVPYSLRVVTPPDRTFYEVGEELDTKGLSLELLYNDGTSETVTKDFTCESVVFDELGTRQIEVSYKGLTATFLVDVTQITGIRVAEPPKKTDYLVGESLEPRGLTLEVVYENGKSRTVTEGFSYLRTKFTEPGPQEVTVYYGGAEASYSVEVLPDVDFGNMESYYTCVSYGDDSGKNAYGGDVNWAIIFEFDLPAEIRNNMPLTGSSSWGHVTNGEGTWEESCDYESAKKGVTFLETGYYEAQNSPTDNERFSFILYLPDDPGIEGPQSVDLHVGNTTMTVNFVLDYAGGYETGTGWAAHDFTYSLTKPDLEPVEAEVCIYDGNQSDRGVAGVEN